MCHVEKTRRGRFLCLGGKDDEVRGEVRASAGRVRVGQEVEAVGQEDWGGL